MVLGLFVGVGEETGEMEDVGAGEGNEELLVVVGVGFGALGAVACFWFCGMIGLGIFVGIVGLGVVVGASCRSNIEADSLPLLGASYRHRGRYFAA